MNVHRELMYEVRYFGVDNDCIWRPKRGKSIIAFEIPAFKNNMGNGAEIVLDVTHQSRREAPNRASPTPFHLQNHLLMLSQHPTSRGQADGATPPLPTHPPSSNAIYLHEPPPAPLAPALDVVLSFFAPAWMADANGVAQESRLDWLFQS